MADARPLRVLHLAGSAVDDFHADLSRVYAVDCWDAVADPQRYEPLAAYVTPAGWRFPTDLSDAAIAAAPSVGAAEAVATLAGLGLDVAVPQMFCLPGMTTYRALLDVVGVPYVGNRPETMALAAHKARARGVVAAGGVAVPDGELLRSGERARLEPPVVVKPAEGDNSLGLSLVRDAAGLEPAVGAAREHAGPAGEVLVERYVELGREVRCGIVELDGEPLALPLEEYDVDPVAKPVRDHADKLARDASGALSLQAKDGRRAWIVDPADPLTGRVQAAALRCHRALGCRDHSLFDFRIDPDGGVWFLEAGPYCSYARTSVVAVMAAAAGIELGELFARGLAAALSRKTLSRTTDHHPRRAP